MLASYNNLMFQVLIAISGALEEFVILAYYVQKFNFKSDFSDINHLKSVKCVRLLPGIK